MLTWHPPYETTRRSLTTIYHSEVNDDNDGEIENGIPVTAAVDPTALPAPTNVLAGPAYELAYARITKLR